MTAQSIACAIGSFIGFVNRITTKKNRLLPQAAL
jgi:hypothetical protein